MHTSSVFARHRRPAPALLVGLLSIAAGPASEAAVEQLYECEQNGAVTFSDRPCTGEEHKRTLEFDQPSAAESSKAEADMRAKETASDALARTSVLDTEILKTEKHITHLRIERDARLAEMRQQRLLGSEDRDRAAWLNQMNQEMESVYQDYSAQIVAATERLNDLKARRAALDVSDAPVGQGTD